MGTTRLSNYGLELVNLRVLSGGQSNLADLSTQLSTGKKSEDLTDYSASDAQRILNLSSEISSQNSYLSVISTVSATVNQYDTVLTSIEDEASTISSALSSSSTYSTDSADTLANQVSTALTNVLGYLNTSTNGVYLFSGSRFTTTPVNTDWESWASPPTDVVVGNTTLPLYDTNYGTTDATTIEKAWTNNKISIDTSTQVTYGISSDQAGFQELILGLRWAYAATQDETNYSTYLATAKSYINDAVSHIQSIHTGSSSASNLLDTTESNINTNISSLESSLDDLQSVDTSEVSVKITTYQSTLEASYSAIGILAKLSILNYL
jgi:flagellar hook-associated protein 3 FlgL